MGIGDDLGTIGSGIVNAGNAVTDLGRGAASSIADTAVSFGESVASYALVAGKEVASAGTTLGAGVFSFGDEIERFSVGAGREVFAWARTSAHDVERWAESGAGAVASFSIDAFERAVPVVHELWKLIKALISSSLSELDDPSDAARALARVALGPASLVHEENARRGGMTISFTLSAQLGAVFGVAFPVGLYVDRSREWGFLKLPGWDQFKALQTASLGQDIGASVTLDIHCVFGGRDRYSGARYFDLGGNIDIGAFKVGAGLMIDADDLGLLGFRMTSGLGISYPSSGGGGPQATLNGDAINAGNLLGSVGDSGPVHDAAVRAELNPGSAPHVLAAALAPTMGPFTPRFYGFLRPLADPTKILCNTHDLIVGSADSPAGRKMPYFRVIAGLDDPRAVTLEAIDARDVPNYVIVLQDQVRILTDPGPTTPSRCWGR